MQEETLLDLYFSRSETALEQTKQQYGTYCYAIAYRILAQPQDAEECENETYWKAWQVIPPNRPHSLKAFLRKITRNLALHFWERNHFAAVAERNQNRICAAVLVFELDCRDCPEKRHGREQSENDIAADKKKLKAALETEEISI